ncbi:MAG: hypothetical protein HOC91_07925 [Nitrospinaceae bacterium]|nr:hypothetical protein [Nitrospinaceae bacterium]MBT3820524.1 hypothetical protein [Nitrospinaceae bacterium]MBT4094884.1 hypothetical protein [Nitrospinaceae bacterium]MBT4430425.1 hypothetical protein [Nitrospinaceae bacterium]MBT5368685.1 hypothetical protein [Nitrospinaceae bacterium]
MKRKNNFSLRLKSRLSGYCRIIITVAFASTMAGFTGNFPTGLFHSLEVNSYLNRNARITKIKAHSPIFGSLSDLAAVVVNYEGHTLHLKGNNLTIDPTKPDTLLEIIENEPESYRFSFFEVKNLSGKTMGYLFARDEWLEFISLSPGGELFLSADDPAEP